MTEQSDHENKNQVESTSGNKTNRPRMGLFKKLLNPSMIFSSVSDNELVNEGYLLVRKEKYDEAVAAFKEVIKEDKGCIDGYVGMGKALCAKGGIENAKKSLAYFQKALELDFGRLSIYEDKIDVYERLGDKKNVAAERKKQFVAKTLKSNPHDAKAINNLGIIQLQQKNLSAAISSFKKAIKVDKSLLVARSNLANALYQKALKAKNEIDAKHMLKQSKTLISQVLEKEQTPENYLVSAKILMSLEDFDNAAEACDKALAIDPSMKEIFNTKRVIEENRGNIGQATHAYENYQSLTKQEQKTKKEKFESPFE